MYDVQKTNFRENRFCVRLQMKLQQSASSIRRWSKRLVPLQVHCLQFKNNSYIVKVLRIIREVHECDSLCVLFVCVCTCMCMNVLCNKEENTNKTYLEGIFSLLIFLMRGRKLLTFNKLNQRPSIFFHLVKQVITLF